MRPVSDPPIVTPEIAARLVEEGRALVEEHERRTRSMERVGAGESRAVVR